MGKAGRPSLNMELYNEEIKERFLERYTNIGTRERYRKVFRRTYPFEIKENKDVYNFSLDEIKDMLYSLESKSQATITSTVSIIGKYIEWAINEKYLENPINVTTLIDVNEMIKMVSNIAQEVRYLTGIGDLRTIVNLCVNAQDAVCFILSFYGLRADDILNITKDDIDGNIINVGKRKIEISDEFMKKINEAFDETVYVKLNGVNVDNRTKNPQSNLDLNSRYLIRGTLNKRRDEGEKVTRQVINKRIKKVVESFGYKEEGRKFNADLHKQLLTLTTVFYSGIFHFLKEIEDEKGELKQEDYMNIRERYELEVRNWRDTESKYHLWKKTL